MTLKWCFRGDDGLNHTINRTLPLVGGELLYNSNEVESHIALQIVERTIRMTLIEQEKNEQGLSTGQGGFQKEKEDEEEDDFPPPPPPRPMWNGPERPPPIAWDSGGGGGGRRQQIAERI